MFNDQIDFTCECATAWGSAEERDGTFRQIYTVTDRHGEVTTCAYCDACAAESTRNGEIVSCVLRTNIVDEEYEPGVPGRACLDCCTGWPASESDNEPHHHNRDCPTQAVALVREMVSR